MCVWDGMKMKQQNSEIQPDVKRRRALRPTAQRLAASYSSCYKRRKKRGTKCSIKVF